MYLAEPILKKIFTRFVWGHPFSTYVSYNLLFNQNFNLLTRMFTICGFTASTHAINLPICPFSLPTYAFNLAIRVFSVLSCGFELVPRGFELATRRFEPVPRRFELVTRVLLFQL